MKITSAAVWVSIGHKPKDMLAASHISWTAAPHHAGQTLASVLTIKKETRPPAFRKPTVGLFPTFWRAYYIVFLIATLEYHRRG